MAKLLTVIILSKNEERNIVDCIDTVDFSDEIIIVDDYSSDRTIELVKHLSNPKIKIFKRHLSDNFAAQHNFGLSKAESSWVLFLDADERISPELKEEILQELLNGDNRNIKGYYFKRYDDFLGKLLMHGEVGSVRLLRLARKNAGEWSGQVHEIWEIRGGTKEFENFLLHHPNRSISDFLDKINFYTTIRAKELHEKKVKIKGFDIVVYPLLKFILNYLIKKGYKDGLHGFVHASFMSLHSFLVRGKLYLLFQKKG